MNTNQNLVYKNKRLGFLLLAATAILTIPLIAMQFTSEVDWNLFDFLIMGILLYGTVFAIEFIFRFIKTKTERIVFSAIVLILFILIWMELAVGIFGSPIAGN
jgi:hypothetical protein